MGELIQAFADEVRAHAGTMTKLKEALYWLRRAQANCDHCFTGSVCQKCGQPASGPEA